MDATESPALRGGRGRSEGQMYDGFISYSHAELMPIRVGKRVSESSGAEFYRPYDPRDVSTVSPLRFTLIVSADVYPDESDRVVVEVGLHYPRDSLRTYVEVVDVEHLVGGSPKL